MIERTQYMDRLARWRDTRLIKVITGVRRCGKSTLLRQFQQALIASGTPPERVISLNFEDLRYESLTDYHALYDYITARLAPEGMNYVFLDEVQLVDRFQRAVDSLFLRDNVDIYLTGSNAYLLSGDLATLLSGRYVEIRMLPFSFKEYYQLVGGDRKAAFLRYFTYGGFPYAATLSDEDLWGEYLRGIYHTVLVKDIVTRRNIGDVPLLEAVVRFLFDNVGSMVSVKKIADSLTSGGRKTSPATVAGYLAALQDAFILYRAGRYDIRGKEHLKSLEKYYLVDPGLRTAILGRRTADIGHVLENMVYLELLRRGYEVMIGKEGRLEVDFVARKDGDRAYFQVAATVLDPATYAREWAPLRQVRDNYPKYVLTMDEFPLGEEGIRQKNVIDFLLE